MGKLDILCHKKNIWVSIHVGSGQLKSCKSSRVFGYRTTEFGH